MDQKVDKKKKNDGRATGFEAFCSVFLSINLPESISNGRPLSSPERIQLISDFSLYQEMSLSQVQIHKLEAVIRLRSEWNLEDHSGFIS